MRARIRACGFGLTIKAARLPKFRIFIVAQNRSGDALKQARRLASDYWRIFSKVIRERWHRVIAEGGDDRHSVLLRHVQVEEREIRPRSLNELHGVARHDPR